MTAFLIQENVSLSSQGIKGAVGIRGPQGERGSIGLPGFPGPKGQLGPLGAEVLCPKLWWTSFWTLIYISMCILILLFCTVHGFWQSSNPFGYDLQLTKQKLWEFHSTMAEYMVYYIKCSFVHRKETAWLILCFFFQGVHGESGPQGKQGSYGLKVSEGLLNWKTRNVWHPYVMILSSNCSVRASSSLCVIM